MYPVLRSGLYSSYGDPIESLPDMTPYRTVFDDGSTQDPTMEPHPELRPHPHLPVSSRSTLILPSLGSSTICFSLQIFGM